MPPKPPPGHFNILYFASAGQYTSKSVEVLPAPLPLRDLFAELERRYNGIRASADEEAAEGEGVVIQEGDEVAIIPPVSSG
ncbi:hypothetical protein VTJ49DRAFT_114 [Mycothermus thermophilus]|uniref:Molybdopterin synthase sulfur carrier subunit n=1 Tax=Humicola insolens TaxID=85995 RepID=A0ABR3VPZ0_HUMIN